MIVSEKKLVETVLKFTYPDRLTKQLWVSGQLVHTHIFNHKGGGKYLYEGWQDKKEAYISFESFMEEENEQWVAEFDNDMIELFVYNKEARIVKKYTEKDEGEVQSYLENKNYLLFTSQEELSEYLNNERLLSYKEIEQIFKDELQENTEFSAFTNNLLKLIEQKLCQKTTK